MTTRPRPRLILHAGTPKTGTKTVQAALYAARDRLAAHGILYPEVDLSHERKHQWLVNLLNAGDVAGFRHRVRELVDQTEALHPNCVILSTEGLYLHWSDFGPAARQEIAELCGAFDTTVWVVFREPLSFATSLYSQVLKNPPSHLTECYATSSTFDDIVRHPWFATRLRYATFITEIEELLGAGRVVVGKFESADMMTQVRALLGVDAETLPDVTSRNHGLKAIGVDLIRRLNGVSFDPGERQRLVDVAVELDRLLGTERPPVSDEAIRAVDELSAEGVRYLETRFGIRWPQRARHGGAE